MISATDGVNAALMDREVERSPTEGSSNQKEVQQYEDWAFCADGSWWLYKDGSWLLIESQPTDGDRAFECARRCAVLTDGIQPSGQAVGLSVNGSKRRGE
jgi:hypothetical protein